MVDTSLCILPIESNYAKSFFEESLFNTAAQSQKYNNFHSTEPILERHLHLTRFQKNTLLIVFMDKVYLDYP